MRCLLQILFYSAGGVECSVPGALGLLRPRPPRWRRRVLLPAGFCSPEAGFAALSGFLEVDFCGFSCCGAFCLAGCFSPAGFFCPPRREDFLACCAPVFCFSGSAGFACSGCFCPSAGFLPPWPRERRRGRFFLAGSAGFSLCGSLSKASSANSGGSAHGSSSGSSASFFDFGRSFSSEGSGSPDLGVRPESRRFPRPDSS